MEGERVLAVELAIGQASNLRLRPAQRWEGLAVVRARRSSTATATTTSSTATTTELATGTILAASATETTTATSTLAAVTAISAVATITTISTISTITTVSTTISTSTPTSTAGGGLRLLSEVAARVNISHINSSLLLLLPETSSLALAGSHEVLLIVLAGEGLALGELLAGALVGLADGQVTTELQLLLGDLGEMLLVGLGLHLGLGGLLWLLGGGWDAGVEALGLFGFGDGFAGFLVCELGFARLAAPGVRSLLCVVAIMC